MPGPMMPTHACQASLALAATATGNLEERSCQGGIRFVEKAMTGRCPCEWAEAEGCQDCDEVARLGCPHVIA